MLKNLGDIYKHCNEKLLEDQLNDISDIIEYLEECQNIIVEGDPLEAPIVTITLSGNSFDLPENFKTLNKVVQIDTITPVEIWANVLYLPSTITSGDVKLYYFRKPTALDPDNLDQVPDVDPKYYPLMAKYAAEMYYLVDDDEDMRAAFKDSFFQNYSLIANKKSTDKKYNFTNLW
jgi:hypothetical protein